MKNKLLGTILILPFTITSIILLAKCYALSPVLFYTIIFFFSVGPASFGFFLLNEKSLDIEKSTYANEEIGNDKE